MSSFLVKRRQYHVAVCNISCLLICSLPFGFVRDRRTGQVGKSGTNIRFPMKGRFRVLQSHFNFSFWCRCFDLDCQRSRNFFSLGLGFDPLSSVSSLVPPPPPTPSGWDDCPSAVHPVSGPHPLHPPALVQTPPDPPASEERQRRGGQRDPLHPLGADGRPGPRELEELPGPGAKLQRDPQYPRDSNSGWVQVGLGRMAGG